MLMLLGNCFAANYAVGPSATGNGSGSDYNNLLAWSSTLTRGNSYYLVDGTYAGKTFSTAVSGTTLITVKKATDSDYGGLSNWSSGLGDGQASFTGGLVVQSSYWVIDGAKGSMSKTASDYGFVTASSNGALSAYNINAVITDITFSHFTGTAPGGDVEKFFFSTDNSSEGVHYLTISHCLANGWSNFQWGTAGYEAADNKNDYWLSEYNVILNGYSSAAQHGEEFNNNYGNCRWWTIRYNWIEGRDSGTGGIVALNAPSGPYYIYGNVFYDITVGDGIIAGVHYSLQAYIYNNAFISCNNRILGSDTGVTGEFRNNVCYNSNAGFQNSTPTNTHNGWWSCSNVTSGTSAYTGTGNPFVNIAAGDFSLTPAAVAAMDAGYTLSSPYTQDWAGTQRGADGEWDRGAIEYVDGEPTPTPVPARSFGGTGTIFYGTGNYR